MTKEQVRQRILEVKIVPVVRASSPEQALGAADAVRAGGIPIVEVTMTVPGAIEVIAEPAGFLAARTEEARAFLAGLEEDWRKQNESAPSR